MRGLILFALSCTYAFGQIQFLLVDAPGSEKPVSTMFQVGAAPVGDRVDTVFRVRNTSQTQLVIRTLTLAGAAFSIFGQPSLPHTLAPGLNMDFTVRFAPKDYGSYSANLAVNGVGLLLAGSSTAAPVVSVDGTQRPAGSSIDLGLAERGASISKTFRLENTTSERRAHPDRNDRRQALQAESGYPAPDGCRSSHWHRLECGVRAGGVRSIRRIARH